MDNTLTNVGRIMVIGEMQGCVMVAADALSRIEELSQHNNTPLNPKADAALRRLRAISGDIVSLSVALGNMAEDVASVLTTPED